MNFIIRDWGRARCGKWLATGFAPRAGSVQLDRRVVEVEHDGRVVTSFLTRDHEGRQTRYQGRHFLSTLPIRDLIRAMKPSAPAEVIHAAESLKYRDFLTVVLIVDRAETFPDNWIYIHEPQVRVGRIQNFKNWSPDLVPDPSKTSLGLEYFCFEGDDLWTMSDADLLALGRREIDSIGLVSAVRGHRRLRRPHAQGLSGLRRRLPGSRRSDSRLAERHSPTSSWPAATACTSIITKTTR